MNNSKCIFVCVAIYLFIGCTKEQEFLNMNLQPDEDKLIVKYNDTLKVDAYTLKGNPYNTTRKTLNLLGTFNDPVFGKTTASIITQFTTFPTYEKIYSGGLTEQGQPGTIDSLILYLDQTSFYGSATTTQRINIYELNSLIPLDSTYFSNEDFGDYYDVNTIIGSTTYTPLDSSNIISIKLPNSIGTKFLDADSITLADIDNFKDLFYGLYIESESIDDEGAISTISLYPQSKLTIYYNDSLSYNFYIDNTTCVSVNLYNHDYTSSLFIHDLDSFDNPDESIYLQSMGGVQGFLKFPSLSNWKDSLPLAINSAELIIQVDNENIEKYPPPENIIITIRIDDTLNVSIPDDPYFTSADYFDGKYDSTSSSYRFNITSYIQNTIDGDLSNSGIYLTPGYIESQSSYSATKYYSYYETRKATRGILKAGSGSDRIILQIKYIKL